MPTPEIPRPPFVEPAQRPLQAMMWMVVTGILFVGVTAIVKYLDGRLPAAQSAFLRYLLGLVLLIPMVPSLIRLRFPARIWVIFAVRGLAHSIAVILWFFAMAAITIAEVTAMSYLAPIYVTLGAALFFGERLQSLRLVAICVALVGALIILRPGIRPLELGHFAMMATAILFSISFLTAKKLTSVAPPMIIVALLSISVTLGILPFAIAEWQPPTWSEIAWLSLVAALATLGHYTMTLAIQSGPLAVTQPVTFLQLVWAGLVGYFIFGEPVDVYVVIGGLVIVGSVCFIAIREAQLRSQDRL